MKKRSEWEVLVKYNNDNIKGIPASLMKATDEELRYGVIEFSVIRSSNKHGHRSWGWNDIDKLVMFDDDEVDSRGELKWKLKVLKTIAEALNEAGL